MIGGGGGGGPCPTYVIHDDKRWLVRGTAHIDGEPAYMLSRPFKSDGLIYARVTECEKWTPGPIHRVWRGDNAILESDGRTMTIRKVGARVRYPTSLEAIYSMTVKAHVANERAKKARR